MKINTLYMLFISIIISMPQAHAMGLLLGKKAISIPDAKMNIGNLGATILECDHKFKNKLDQHYAIWVTNSIYNFLDKELEKSKKKYLSKHIYQELIRILESLAAKKGMTLTLPEASFIVTSKKEVYLKNPDLGLEAFKASEVYEKCVNKSFKKIENPVLDEISETIVAPDESASIHEAQTAKLQVEQKNEPASPVDKKIVNENKPSLDDQGTTSACASDDEDDLFLVNQLKGHSNQNSQAITSSLFQKIMSNKLAIITGSTAVGAIAYIIYLKYQEKNSAHQPTPQPAAEQSEHAEEKLNQIKLLIN